VTGRVLVTGAAGFIGAQVCRELVAGGWAVRGLDNFDAFYDPRLKRRRAAALTARPGCEMMEGDVRDPAVLDRALDGVGAVVHLAARPGVRQSLHAPARYHAVNVGGTAALLEACGRAGIRRLVFASSSSVYGRGSAPPFREDGRLGQALSPYAATKREGERLVEAAAARGFRAAVLRLFSIYGPEQRPDLALHRFTAALAAGRPVVRLGDGGETRDYTHVRDAARAARAALDWTGARAPGSEAFNIGSGRPVRLDWFIAAVGRALGRTPVVRVRPAHPADLPATWADRGKAEAVLGWAPREDLEAGIAEFVAWYGEVYGHESRSAA
jgi:UDP-glucuronate 4-epimerase